MNRAGTLLEVIWFVMGGLFIFIGVDITVENDWSFTDSWYYLLFGLLAILMYLRRRRIRLSDK